MSILEKPEYITPAEYLEGEKLSPIKHEYIDGKVCAMSDSTRRHNTITGNMGIMLLRHFDDTPCMVYIIDIKVRVEGANCYYYPDVVVTCDERDNLDGLANEDDAVDDTMVRFPQLIIEVLSKSTEAFDRGTKFTHYRTLETLEEYVVITQDRMSVERYQREANGIWSIHPAITSGGQVHLTSIDLSFPVEALYTKVNLAQADH